MAETERKVSSDYAELEPEQLVAATPIEEIDQVVDAKPQQHAEDEVNVRKNDGVEPSVEPHLCQMPQKTSGGSGWGSWAASFLSTALQLDEEDDQPYTPVENKREPGSVIDSQPDLNLPSQNSAIERGASKEKPDAPETQSSYGTYGISGLGSWGTGWVSGAFSSAKQQSANAAQFLKKDLSEFATVVKNDTAGIASVTSKTLQTKLNVSDESVGKFKGDVSYFLGSVKSTLYQTTTQFYSNSEDEDNQPYDTMNRNTSAPCTENTLESKLSNIYKDQDTYLKDPVEMIEYEKYQREFDVEAIKSDISNLLISQSEVRMFYSKLVPSQVSHADFWCRLWFKRHCVEADFERKHEILSKVQTSLHGDLLDWGDDDDEDENCIDAHRAGVKSEAIGADSPLKEDADDAKDSEGLPEGNSKQTTNIDNDGFEPIDIMGMHLSDGAPASGDAKHIEDIADSSQNNAVHTPPESTTSDEWEKDFDEVRN